MPGTGDAPVATRARAVVYEGPERISIREYPLPRLGSDDLLVEIDLAGVDGSEVHMFRGELEALNRITPVILGDEIVGRVVAIGDGAAARRHLRAGDSVVVEARWPCDACHYCQVGQYYLCESGTGSGYGWITCDAPPHLWGGYATHVFVPRDALVHRVPPGMSADTALLCGSVLANSVRWTRVSGVELGSTVVVVGPGPQGIGCALLASLRGADVVVVGLARDAARLRMASDFGAGAVVSVEQDEPVEDSARRVRDVLGDRRVDIVIEAAGAQSAKDLAVELVRPQGVIANVSVAAPARLSLDWHRLLLKEVTLLTPFAHPHSIAASLEVGSRLLDKGIDVGRLVSHHFPLDDAELALRTAGYELGEHPTKVALRPQPAGVA